MEWRDEGIVLSVRRHGETSVILDVLTRGHGRHAGLVRGGRSARQRSALQPGNSLDVSWRARLEEHLGGYTAELLQPRAAIIMNDPAALAGLSSMCWLSGLLAERQPCPEMFEASQLVLDMMNGQGPWPALLARWELGLLSALGFGLDLSRCAATGGTDNLTYVSPKSSIAVSAEAGLPYADRLIALPGFFRDGGCRAPSHDEINQGFILTGFFLDRHVIGPRGLKMPDARLRMMQKLMRIV